MTPVDEVDDIEAYDTVILGSAVYGQRWIPNASEFLRRNADALADRRVWLFSVGSFGDTHRGIGRLMTKEPRDIKEIRETVHPLDYRVFAGAPSLSTSGETLTIEELLTLRARTETAGDVGVEHEWSWARG